MVTMSQQRGVQNKKKVVQFRQIVAAIIEL